MVTFDTSHGTDTHLFGQKGQGFQYLSGTCPPPIEGRSFRRRQCPAAAPALEALHASYHKTMFPNVL